MTEDDVQELENVVAEVAKKSLKVLNMQQENVVGQVSEHLNKLIEAINDVKATIEAETYGMDPNVPLVTQELVSPIKVQIHRCTMETGMAMGVFDDVVKEFDTL